MLLVAVTCLFPRVEGGGAASGSDVSLYSTPGWRVEVLLVAVTYLFPRVEGGGAASGSDVSLPQGGGRRCC